MNELAFDFHTHVAKEAAIIASETPLAKPPTRSIGSLMLHPWGLDKKPLSVDWQELAKRAEVKVIGEIGLDKQCNVEWDLQLQTFKEIVSLVNKLEKPLILHCVKAYDPMLETLTKYQWKRPVIFHKFNRSAPLLGQIFKLGFWVSFGVDVLDRTELRELIAANLSQIGLESDDKKIDMNDFYCRFAKMLNISRELLFKQMADNFKMVTQ